MLISGETLRLLRHLKNLKQKTVADRLGVSQPAYSKLEKSKSIKDEKAEKLLKLIDCTISDLEVVQRISSIGDER